MINYFYFFKVKRINWIVILFFISFILTAKANLSNAFYPKQSKLSIKKINFRLNKKYFLAKEDEKFQKKEKNPAFEILEKIWKNKPKSALNFYKTYTYDRHEKTSLRINKLEEKKNKNFLERKIEGIFKKLFYKNENILPVYSRESHYKIYGRNYPSVDLREDLVGRNELGIKEDFIFRELKSIKLIGNIYDNRLTLFNRVFTSPLSQSGFTNYHYELVKEDLTAENHHIKFWPKFEGDFTFIGEMWVDKKKLLLKKIILRPNKKTNLNFVKAIQVEQNFSFTKEAHFFLTHEHLKVNIEDNLLSKKNLSLKTTNYYTNQEFENTSKSYFFYQRNNSLSPKKLPKEESYWEKIRPETLSNLDKKSEFLLKELQKNPTFNFLHKSLDFISKNGYLNLRGIDLGPFDPLDLIRKNSTEGWRVQLGARTFFDLNDFWKLNGYLAYGFKDQKLKYGLGGRWMIQKPSRWTIGASYKKDLVLGGLNTLINKDIKNPSYQKEIIEFSSSIEFIRNFMVGLSIEQNTSWTPKNQELWLRNLKGEKTSKINDFKLGAFINFRPKAKYLSYGVDRIVDPTIYFPGFILSYTLGLKNIFKSEFDYQKINFSYTHPILIAKAGLLSINLDLGKIIGGMPFHMLRRLPTNLDFLFSSRAFTQVKPFEFLMDTYGILFLRHNFNGQLFRYVPLLKYLKLREIVFLRSAWGDLSERNKVSLKEVSHKTPTKPYFEYGFGIENIGWGKIRPLGVYFNWRGNHFDKLKKDQKKNKINKFGFNLNLKLAF